MKSLIALGLATLLTFGSANVVGAGEFSLTDSYSGIIGLGGDPGDQGKISIAITATGQYTLRGKIAGIGFSDKGQLSETGTVSDDFVIKLLGGFIQIPVHLEFATTPDGEQINGTATFQFQGDSATLDFTLHKSAQYTKDSPAPQTGRHVIVFTPEETSDPLPGRGVATVNVSRTGFVTVAGVLADGAKISCGGSLSSDGTFPILNLLYGRTGFVAGFAKFNNAVDEPNLTSWVRITPKGVPVFAGTLVADIYPYAPPAKGLPAIAFGNQENAAPLSLSGGGLTNFPLTTVQVSDTNKVTVIGENESKLELQLNKKTGLISGSIKLEIGDTTQNRPIKMVILQGSGFAQGFFISPEPSANAVLGVE